MGSTSNIASDFLYRGIYTRQLHRLHTKLGPNRLLVLTDTQLRKEPQLTFDALCDFAGLPRLNLTGVGEKEVGRALDTLYPQFSKTGWRMEGGYEPMSKEARALLQDFYAPYNRALYEFLGVDLGW